MLKRAERMATLKADLDAQIIAQMRRKKDNEASERERDLQDLMYRQVYTGFGRPGCGAPLRNSEGGVLANLGDVPVVNGASVTRKFVYGGVSILTWVASGAFRGASMAASTGTNASRQCR